MSVLDKMRGLFDYGPTEEQQWNRDYRLATMDPRERLAMEQMQHQRAVGEGLGKALGAAVGADTRSVAERVKAQVQEAGVDPNDIDKYYPTLIRALASNGAVLEAREVAKEYEELRLKQQDRKVKQQNADTALAKQQATAQFLKDKAAAIGKGPFTEKMQAYADILTRLQATNPTDPEYGQLTNMARMVEASFGIKAKDGVKVVPASKYGQGGVVKVNPDGSFVFVPVDEMNKAGESGDAKTDTQNPDAPSGSKTLPGGQLEKLASGAANVLALTKLANEFREDFSGGVLLKVAGVLGAEDLVLNMQKIFNTNPAAARWWQSYKTLITQIRHELFGATLTEGERTAFEQIKANLAQPPEGVLSFVRNQATDAVHALEERVQQFGAGGYNVSGLYPRLQAAKSGVQTIPAAPRRRNGNGAKPVPKPGAVAPEPKKEPQAPSNGGWSIKRKS